MRKVRILVNPTAPALDDGLDGARAAGNTAPTGDFRRLLDGVTDVIEVAEHEPRPHHRVQRDGSAGLMHLYTAYYERSRTHLSLDKDAPIPRPIAQPTGGRIVEIPQVGGLHHRYERHAA